MCWVCFNGKRDSCYTHLCSTRRCFLLCFCMCLMRVHVFTWYIIMYAPTSLCIKLEMLSDLLRRHLRFQLHWLFWYTNSLNFIFLSFLRVEWYHAMSLHVVIALRSLLGCCTHPLIFSCKVLTVHLVVSSFLETPKWLLWYVSCSSLAD